MGLSASHIQNNLYTVKSMNNNKECKKESKFLFPHCSHFTSCFWRPTNELISTGTGQGSGGRGYEGKLGSRTPGSSCLTTEIWREIRQMLLAVEKKGKKQQEVFFGSVNPWVAPGKS